MPTMAAAAISTVSRMIDVTPRPAARYASAVAQPRPASTKNCQGRRPSSSFDGRRSSFFVRTPPPGSSPAKPRTGGLIEVPEFIVDPLVEIGIAAGNRRGRVLAVPRPLDGGESDGDDAEPAHRVGHEPREAIEAAVERRAERLLAAVGRDEVLPDLIPVLPEFDLLGELILHLRGLTAVALGQRTMTAVADLARRADDLVPHLLLERVLRRPLDVV